MDSNKSIPGIPYFGLETQDIMDKIKTSKISRVIEYNSLYDLIQSEKSPTKLIVIDTNTNDRIYGDNEISVSYLRDICFNYRDKEIFIPYYIYKIFKTPKESKKSMKIYKGHLLDLGDSIGIRYEYKLCSRAINLTYNEIMLYDLEANDLYMVTFNKYYSKSTFNIQELYNNYLAYCCDNEDYKLLKHTEGYHLISKNIEGVKNHERIFRKRFNLNDYQDSSVNFSYRDVRNFTLSEFEAKLGFFDFSKPYWERKLDFESQLYCIMRDNVIPDDTDIEFKEEFKKFMDGKKQHIKYGDEIKLIFKDYWINYRKSSLNKTWSRV